MPEVTEERFFQAAAEHQQQWAETDIIRPDWYPEKAGVYPMELIGISWSETKRGNWAIYPQLKCLAPGSVNKVDGGWYLQVFTGPLPQGEVETPFRRRCMGHVASLLSQADLEKNALTVMKQLKELADKRTVFNISYEKRYGDIDPNTGKPTERWDRSVKSVDLSSREEVILTDPNEAPWDKEEEPNKNTS